MNCVSQLTIYKYIYAHVQTLGATYFSNFVSSENRRFFFLILLGSKMNPVKFETDVKVLSGGDISSKSEMFSFFFKRISHSFVNECLNIGDTENCFL